MTANSLKNIFNVLCSNLVTNSLKIQRCDFHKSSGIFGRYSGRKVVQWPEEYTTRKIRLVSTGGRGEDGKIETARLGGGHKRHYRMIDQHRTRPLADYGINDTTLLERVKMIEYDPNRSARIALVAAGQCKRYVIATTSMKVGDIIKTSTEIPLVPVTPNDGDSYPLGALPIGTLVSCIERLPGQGAGVAKSAGTCAQIVRKIDGRCTLRMPSKREMNVSQDCMCVVGRVSNPDHNKEVVGKAGRNRWYGIRPRSGLWHRKTGKHGRKINPIKPTVVYTEPKQPKLQYTRLTYE